jgi:hypothetical protein
VNLTEIQAALSKAEKGIAQYAALMSRFPQVDVATDAEFQRKYNAFYRVQRRPESWYRCYYELMQDLREATPVFPDVLEEIHRRTGRYEPSFASKLVATIDPSKPIWDVHILANTSHKAPSYASKHKLENAKTAYASIEDWYSTFLQSTEGKLCISEFDRRAPNHQGFTSTKKVDFILWQTRPKRAKSAV